MSIVYLSSNEQNPHNFTNQFSQGIQLGRGAEVSVMGYSGNLRNRQIQINTSPTEMIIVEGINDAFTFYHGNIASATSLKEMYYQPILLKLVPGIYTPLDLSLHIASQLNMYEYVDQYKEGWTCTYASGTQKFTIKCGMLRATANTAGKWVSYNGTSGGITPAATQDTLIPFTAATATIPEIKRPY